MNSGGLKLATMIVLTGSNRGKNLASPSSDMGRAHYLRQDGLGTDQCFFLTKGPAFHLTAIIGFLTGWSYFSMSFDTQF